MNVAFEYKPLPIFVPFHASEAKDRSVIGGFGSGKSTAGCAEAIALGLEYPGVEILVTRKTAPALRDTTEKTFQQLLPPEFWDRCHVGRAGGHLEHVEFPNGSRYLFRAMDDWRKHRSMNLAFILWDEADEFTIEDYEGMQSRIRQTQPLPAARAQGHTARLPRRGNILASNPSGKNWIWQRFVGPEKKRGHEAFLSSSLDNPTLPLDTINTWLDMPDAWVRRFVLCSFDDFEGAIYPEWSYDTHVVEPYESYHPDGFFLMGFDPGTSAGNAAVWAYYDREKHCVVAVAEYDEAGLAASVHAAAWRKIEAAHKMRRVKHRHADPVVTTRDRGSNVELSEQYRRLGFRFSAGPRKIETRLTALGQLIHQGRFKVTTDCPRLYDKIKAYHWADLTPRARELGTEAKPDKKEVDLVDAAQYLCCAYIKPPALEPPRTPQEQQTAAQHAAIRKQIRRKRRPRRNHDLGSIPL